MKREIEFRGKSLRKNEWIFGNIHVPHDPFDKLSMWDSQGLQVEVKSETVGQFTGLTDKNRVKIFEDDIVKGDFENRLFKVIFMGSAFVIQYRTGETAHIYGHALEVIGNIYDNPELLK
jgi:uncharacterized phage protein (TIGR01671 family)